MKSRVCAKRQSKRENKNILNTLWFTYERVCAMCNWWKFGEIFQSDEHVTNGKMPNTFF